jgi:hypothetical protein
MKFNTLPEKDARYQRIRTPLREAGYDVIRADEIVTSGAVVDEVCRYLREAELVVIDSTGDSLSVAYEIGYCHGVNRSPEATLLLRESSEIPFNYRHFRHRVYKSLVGLEKEVRRFLRLSDPMGNSKVGAVLTFEIPLGRDVSYSGAAQALLDTVRAFRFTGRLESYFRDGYLHLESGSFWSVARTRPNPSDRPQLFSLGFGIQPSQGKLRHDHFEDFREYLAAALRDCATGVEEAIALSEYCTMATLRASFDVFGHADFAGGQPLHFYDPQKNLLRRGLESVG